MITSVRKSALKIWISCSLLVVPNVSFSAQCEEKLKSCKEVVEAGSAVIKQQQEQIIDLYRVRDLQEQQIDTFKIQIEQARPKWYEEPEVVAPVVFILGFITARAVGR